MAVKVRIATREDYPALERLFRELDTLHALLQPAFFQTTRGLSRGPATLDRALSDPEATLLCALAGEGDDKRAIGGLIHLRVYATPTAPSMVQRRRVHVEDLFVARAARRRGLGRALMDAGAGWARGRDASQIVLTVWAGNEDAAAFYQALGYRTLSQVLGVEL